MKFNRTVEYDGDTMCYCSGEEIEYNDSKFKLRIAGTVPGSCHVEETEEPLTEEEIETAKETALASVKTVRKIRKIVCHD